MLVLGKTIDELCEERRANDFRDIMVRRKSEEWDGGEVIYLRATNSAVYRGGHLLTPDKPNQWFNGSSLMRLALSEMGYKIKYNKIEADLKNPINCISRHDNGYYFARYTPN